MIERCLCISNYSDEFPGRKKATKSFILISLICLYTVVSLFSVYQPKKSQNEPPFFEGIIGVWNYRNLRYFSKTRSNKIKKKHVLTVCVTIFLKLENDEYISHTM